MTIGAPAASAPSALVKPNTPQRGAVTNTRVSGATYPNPRATSCAWRSTVRWSCRTNFGAFVVPEVVKITQPESGRPISSRAAFLAKVEEESRRYEGDIPRPKRWCGYRVWAERVELWVGQPARAHDRAAWTRVLTPADAGFTGGPWRSTRLQP